MKKCKITFWRFLWSIPVELVQGVRNLSNTTNLGVLSGSIGLAGSLMTVAVYMACPEYASYWLLFIVSELSFFLLFLYGIYLASYCELPC